ncbi:MAG TPA: class I SAM-dependent methyltransferase [Nitrososphaeraceae archaeon]|nr:class I SAM-dependent methyltransferase [Nitrososphaeraceae archaeon]
MDGDEKMSSKNRVKVDFEKELRTNFRGYNTNLTRWWNIRSCNKSHCIAYRNIANYVTTHVDLIPSLVIDYGCGTGRLLGEIAVRFVDTKFIGIDGSSAMLKTAKTYLKNKAPDLLNRIKLLKAPLPIRLLLGKRADLVTFTFPHILSNLYDLDLNSFLELLTYSEIENAMILAEDRGMEEVSNEYNDEDPDLLQSLLVNRVISKNLRSLVKRGSYCLRVELANARREEFPEIFQKRFSFQEGSLDKSFADESLQQPFELVRSEYHRSKVMEDAYEQTGDESDRKGGYWISLLRALG